jgi:rhodanese-related sulfurtransferase
MVGVVDALTLKAWLSEKSEIALFDVREHGQFGEGHPFFAVPLSYSRFELRLPALAPNPAVRLVLCDDGDGVAARAAARAAALGYDNIFVLEGGVAAWIDAGYALYAGVNVPSKTFGELVEHERRTPHLAPQALDAMRKAGENFVIVDGRPFAEYRTMNIPGGICCPNGELVLRIRGIAPDPRTKIVVNCAGRTRSIIGAQTLIDFGVANPVYALENGTQGWFLAGLELETGASRRYAETNTTADIGELQARARTLASAHGVAFVAPAEIAGWLSDTSRTTYLLDVRTPEEFAEESVSGFVHAPGGQLIQATDQWVGARGARLALLDSEEVRAPVAAAWLRQLGHEACVVVGGVSAAAKFAWRQRSCATALPEPKAMGPRAAADALRDDVAQMVDLRPSMAYRRGHVPQAVWSIRPRLTRAVVDRSRTVILVADEPGVAALAAVDLAEDGFTDIRSLEGGQQAWVAAGLPVAATPTRPVDADCVDFLFFTHARHDGNAEAARQYLAWEIGLIDQLDAQERGAFRIPSVRVR